jgi:toxin FitB
VTRYLLDTNIVGESEKPRPSPLIVEWVRNQPVADLFISTFTLAEIWRGILNLPPGRRRAALDTWFAGPEGPRELFRDRLLGFDEGAALEWGRLMAEGAALDQPRSPLDMILAATAVANGCVVVTANERHFRGAVEFFNPLNP